MTLVIMAAGMGSRFGGLKQIEPVGPNGEFIIDYSIYDAIKAGFNKVVFIIKEENYEIFRNTIGKRIEGKISVDYVFQNFNNVPANIELPSDRVKPLGTGHAILCCKDIVNESFAIINADDFYGREGYINASNFIKNNTNTYNYGLVGYEIGKTLAKYGSVKRGVCNIVDNKLLGLIESSIEVKDDNIVATPLDGSEPFNVTNNTVASMNLFVFYPTIFKFMEEDFIKFLENSKNLLTDEFFLPNVVCNHIKNGDITCEVIENHSTWKGITYKEDMEELKEYIESEISNGVYPLNLYN